MLIVRRSEMAYNSGTGLNDDSARGRGIRTFVQALIGLFTGLLVTVWAVDGVPQAVFNYITSSLPNFLLLVGVPAGATGLVSYIWNVLRKDVPNK
jgi:hypothetical protein